jgi:transcriptional regulator with XRE-family HTH domain
MNAGELLRSARLKEGLSQAALARRLEVSQPAVARLEAAGDAITASTLRRTLGALGRSLELRAPARPPSVDETLLREQLRLTPTERLERYEDTYAGLREIALAAGAARELA